jgi:hypothetical protein
MYKIVWSTLAFIDHKHLKPKYFWFRHPQGPEDDFSAFFEGRVVGGGGGDTRDPGRVGTGQDPVRPRPSDRVGSGQDNNRQNSPLSPSPAGGDKYMRYGR